MHWKATGPSEGPYPPPLWQGRCERDDAAERRRDELLFETSIPVSKGFSDVCVVVPVESLPSS
jgi:hypothetical protein